MIWIITLVTIPFVTINYYIGKKDIFSPGFVFCGVFLFSEIVCILESQTFNLDFHYQTLLVLVVGFIAFTLVSWVSVKHYNSLNIVDLNRAKSGSLKSVHVNGLAVYLLIIIQIIVIGLFIGYLSSIAKKKNQARRGSLLLVYGECREFKAKLDHTVRAQDTLENIVSPYFTLFPNKIKIINRLGL